MPLSVGFSRFSGMQLVEKKSFMTLGSDGCSRWVFPLERYILMVIGGNLIGGNLTTSKCHRISFMLD